MKLICFLLGHSMNEYLQTTETSPIGEWIEDGKIVTKKVSIFFNCKRCLQRYKRTETFVKEKENENPSKD